MATLTINLPDEELKFVENYLALEQARFTNRLKVELPRGDFGQVRLPGLSLQPLVENAVRHGIARMIEGGAVEVSVERNGAGCTVTVKNPYDASEGPVNACGFFREGHALANVRERLRLFAGERARIEVREPAPGYVSVSLNLPAELA